MGPTSSKAITETCPPPPSLLLRMITSARANIGFVDAQGKFYIPDRVKELINFAPAELEGIPVTHSAIEDVAVIGVLVHDKSQATELPRALVVLRND